MPNTTRVGAEPHGEVLDEVEVVAEAGVEHDVRRDLGDEEALPRGLEAAERVEREDREVGERRAIDASFQSDSSGVSSIAWMTGGGRRSPIRSRYRRTHWLSIDTPWNRVWKLNATRPSSAATRSISANAAAPSRGSTMPHATGKRSGVASRYAAISSLTRRVSAMPFGRR